MDLDKKKSRGLATTEVERSGSCLRNIWGEDKKEKQDVDIRHYSVCYFLVELYHYSFTGLLFTVL